MLITFRSHMHISDVTNLLTFFWIKLLLKLPKFLKSTAHQTTLKFTIVIHRPLYDTTAHQASRLFFALAATEYVVLYYSPEKCHGMYAYEGCNVNYPLGNYLGKFRLGTKVY